MLTADAEGSNRAFELEVLHELSRARSKPQDVAEALRNRLPLFKGKDYYPADRGGKTSVVTKEGQAAVRDGIAYLEKSAPLLPLADSLVQGLSLAADDHLHDLGERGAIGHQGSDGSTSSERMNRYGSWSGKCGECLWFGRMGTSARQIVEDLIVDDGVASRGHRLGIYDAAYRVAGVRMGPHRTFGACCVIEFASLYEDDEVRLIARVTSGPPAVVAGKEPVKTQWKDLGLCPGCKDTIRGGSVMEALGHKWHKDCFACQAEDCKKSLCGVPFQSHDGMPFCNDCYYSRFGSTCAGCGEKIRGGVLKAMGHTWHKECYAMHDGKVGCSGRPKALSKVAALPPVNGAQPRAPANGKAGKAACARTPPPKSPPKAAAQQRTPLPSKGGPPPKMAAGRGNASAPKKTGAGSAKGVVDSLIMDYADLA